MVGRSLCFSAALMAVVMGSVGTSRAQTQLKAMIFPGLQNLPLIAAQEKGFFKKRGLEVELLPAPGSDAVRNGLAEGKHQIVHAGVDNAVAMVEVAKVDVAVVTGGDNGWNSLMVQGDINSYADLRGKTLAVDAPNTAYALIMYKMLAMNGLKRGDYQVKPVGGGVRRFDVVMQDKSIAGTMLYPPYTFLAKNAGMKELDTAAKAIGPYQASTCFVLRSWAKENADTLVKYIAAYIEGVRWTLDPANKAEATKILAARLKVPEEIAALSYDVAVGPNGFDKDAALNVAGFENVLKIRAETQGGAVTSPDKYIDPSYYRRALASF
jgi:ABC-type nitrate/sulfonate/bicarbonate transport system substrate-binding protein